MKYKKYYQILVVLTCILFSVGCMSSASGTVTEIDGSSQRSDIPVEKINVTGKINLQDNTLSYIGIEVYFLKKDNISQDDNINRVTSPVDYKYKALTNIEGIFSINDFEAGIYDIFIIKQNYSSLEVNNIEISSKANNYIEKTLTIPSKLTGTVLLNDGSSKYGVKVFVGNNVYLTAENGSFSANIPSGTHEIIIDEYGFERIERIVVIESNVDYNAGVFSLKRNYINPDLALLRGKAITSYGISIDNADVMLIGSEKIEYHKTLSTGSFEIPNIDPGNYIVRVINGYYSTDVAVELTEGSMTDIENIVVDNIKKNSIIEIVSEIADDIDFFENIVVKDSNLNIVDCVIERKEDRVIIRGIKNGSYNIYLNSAYYEDIEFDFQSIAGETIVREIIPVERKAVFSGRIKNNSGNGVYCSFRFGDSEYSTDENGYFNIEEVLEGIYSLYINCFGFEEFAASVTVETGVDITGYEIVLSEKDVSGIYKYINTDFIVEKAVQYEDNVILYSDGDFYSLDKESLNISLLFNTDRIISDFLVDSEAVFALDKVNNEIVKISISTGNVKWHASAGIEPFRILKADNELYIFSKGDRKIHIFEKDTGVFKSQHDTGFDIMDAVISDNSIFMADKYGNRIVTFDYVNRLFGSTITNISRPVKLSCYDNKLLVMKDYSSEIEVYNTVNHTRITTINSGLITENLSVGVNRLYSVSDSRITVYSKDQLITDKLENIMSGMNNVVEDNDFESRLFIFEKFQKRITVYFCN